MGTASVQMLRLVGPRALVALCFVTVYCLLGVCPHVHKNENRHLHFKRPATVRKAMVKAEDHVLLWRCCVSSSDQILGQDIK